MSSLHDELTARTIRQTCITCRFIAALTPSERKEWLVEMALVTNSNAALARAMNLRGTKITDGAVREHRQRHQ